tara:strand:- start:624 stop:824 length:201 start_codon:yes stop_codon:yes gene_type:complete
MKHNQTKGYTKDQIEENIDHFIDNEKELLSTCCGWSALGNIHEFDNEHFGNCSKCKEHTDFERIEQ